MRWLNANEPEDQDLVSVVLVQLLMLLFPVDLQRTNLQRTGRCVSLAGGLRGQRAEFLPWRVVELLATILKRR